MRTDRRQRLLPCVLVVALFATACGTVDPLEQDQVSERLSVSSSRVYAADGSEIAHLHGEVNRDIVSLDDIPEHVQDAVIAIEDSRFWSHGGVDARAVVRAAVANMQAVDTPRGYVQGGSTLSQQLVKNIYFPHADRTMEAKVAEARKTMQLERHHSKEEILEMYLNTVYFGRGTYGVAAAARSYFRKHPSDLTPAEAAYLAGVLHDPARYNFSPTQPPEVLEPRREAATHRRNVVLQRMAQLGMLEEAELAELRAEKLELQPPDETRWQYPYFIDMVLRKLGVLRTGRSVPLDPKFDFLGETSDERAETVYRGGLRIYTTLDPHAQQAAEEAIAEIVPDDLERLSASLASIDPRNGFIRALVGGRDYYPEACDDVPHNEQTHACRIAKVNLALGNLGGGSGRQPGSAFKTMVLVQALEQGIPLRTSYSGQPFTHDFDTSSWRVTNYDGSRRGTMDLRRATEQSVNAVFARLLIDGIGGGDAVKGSSRVADMSRKLGVPFPTETEVRAACGERYGRVGDCTPADAVPAISLGAKDVAPLHMASAYATLANDGRWIEPTSILTITDANGRVLYEADPESRRAVRPEVARATTHVLQGVISSGTGTAARIDRPAAGKTGTSQMFRDAWFVGYTPQLATAVWMGNPIPVERGGSLQIEPMTPSNGYPRRIVGGSYPSMIWSQFTRTALAPHPVLDFEPPPEAMLNERPARTGSVGRTTDGQPSVQNRTWFERLAERQQSREPRDSQSQSQPQPSQPRSQPSQPRNPQNEPSEPRRPRRPANAPDNWP